MIYTHIICWNGKPLTSSLMAMIVIMGLNYVAIAMYPARACAYPVLRLPEKAIVGFTSTTQNTSMIIGTLSIRISIKVNNSFT